MSHYAVAVFDDNGEFNHLLRPYNENDKAYFVFEPVSFDDIVVDFDRFQKQNSSWTLDMYIEEFGYIQENGQWGYRHNPNGYWDWYSLDGRNYLFDPVDGFEPEEGQYDYRKNDLNWYPNMIEAGKEAREFWENYVENGSEEFESFFTREYYLDRYKTKEQYVREMMRVVPYAFITPDGVWHSPGRVGWFACSNETAEDWERYVKEWDEFLASDTNPYVNLVDCHI